MLEKYLIKKINQREMAYYITLFVIASMLHKSKIKWL